MARGFGLPSLSGLADAIGDFVSKDQLIALGAAGAGGAVGAIAMSKVRPMVAGLPVIATVNEKFPIALDALLAVVGGGLLWKATKYGPDAAKGFVGATLGTALARFVIEDVFHQSLSEVEPQMMLSQMPSSDQLPGTPNDQLPAALHEIEATPEFMGFNQVAEEERPLGSWLT